VLLLELLVPIGLLIAIYGLQQVVTPDLISKELPSTYTESPQIEFLYSYRPCREKIDTLIWSCPLKRCKAGQDTLEASLCQRRFIAIAPKDNANSNAKTAASNLQSWGEATYSAAMNTTTFKYFASESALQSYITQPEYSINGNISLISAAIIFSSGSPSWAYEVRLNKTMSRGLSSDITAPDTNLPYLDISAKYPRSPDTPYTEAYLNSNYFTLTDLVTSYIAQTTSGKSEAKYVTQGIAEFPNPDDIAVGFWSLIGFSFALVMIIGILYPLANIISALVREKESKIREGMMMMALHGGTYY
jgi:ATP-binding cassette, subfamily A (ABC1), member 3